jgi:hypothetical protein
MRGLAAAELLLLPVRLHGIQLGRPVDVLLDPDRERAIGLDVISPDDVHSFLPLAAAEVEGEEIAVESALLLLDDRELAFYRAQGHGLRGLRGAGVEHDGDPVGVLRDVAIGSGGEVTELLVEKGGERRWLPSGDLDVVPPDGD